MRTGYDVREGGGKNGSRLPEVRKSGRKGTSFQAIINSEEIVYQFDTWGFVFDDLCGLNIV